MKFRTEKSNRGTEAMPVQKKLKGISVLTFSLTLFFVVALFSCKDSLGIDPNVVKVPVNSLINPADTAKLNPQDTTTKPPIDTTVDDTKNRYRVIVPPYFTYTESFLFQNDLKSKLINLPYVRNAIYCDTTKPKIILWMDLSFRSDAMMPDMGRKDRIINFDFNFKGVVDKDSTYILNGFSSTSQRWFNLVVATATQSPGYFIFHELTRDSITCKLRFTKIETAKGLIYGTINIDMTNRFNIEIRRVESSFWFYYKKS